MYPELMTRHDLKVFLPPIGGMTAYIFGNPDYLRDESKELTLRIHDECESLSQFDLFRLSLTLLVCRQWI